MKHFVDDLQSLRLEVYTVGYTEKGESQIILLKDILKDNILFSCVIDCFTVSGINKTLDILKQSGITKLDFFIWTHTDEDHSIGIDQIINAFGLKETYYILPEGINGNEKDFVEYNAQIQSTFDIINSFNTGQNYRVNSATVIKGNHQQIHKRIYTDSKTNTELLFEINAIAPISAIIRRRWDEGELKKKNDVSIAALFKIGDINLLFSGDIENQTIRQIPDHYFSDITYLKTPHHTSNSSTELINKIITNYDGIKIPSTVSTSFKTHNLPVPSLVQEYLKYSDVFNFTGDGINGFGYIKTVFDIIKNELISEELHGDACVLN